jgi:hypothetical protein
MTDPVEAYFTLTSQAVRLNCAHIDSVASIPPSELYKKAQRENIPFNKWYSWIESQLTSAYINDLYALPTKR